MLDDAFFENLSLTPARKTCVKCRNELGPREYPGGDGKLYGTFCGDCIPAEQRRTLDHIYDQAGLPTPASQTEGEDAELAAFHSTLAGIMDSDPMDVGDEDE